MTLEEAVRLRAFRDAFVKWAQADLVGQHITQELMGAAPGLMSFALPIAGMLSAMGTRPVYFVERPYSTWKALQDRRRTSGLEF